MKENPQLCPYKKTTTHDKNPNKKKLVFKNLNSRLQKV